MQYEAEPVHDPCLLGIGWLGVGVCARERYELQRPAASKSQLSDELHRGRLVFQIEAR